MIEEYPNPFQDFQLTSRVMELNGFECVLLPCMTDKGNERKVVILLQNIMQFERGVWLKVVPAIGASGNAAIGIVFVFAIFFGFILAGSNGIEISDSFASMLGFAAIAVCFVFYRLWAGSAIVEKTWRLKPGEFCLVRWECNRSEYNKFHLYVRPDSVFVDIGRKRIRRHKRGLTMEQKLDRAHEGFSMVIDLVQLAQIQGLAIPILISKRWIEFQLPESTASDGRIDQDFEVESLWAPEQEYDANAVANRVLDVFYFQNKGIIENDKIAPDAS